jgi:hypothetical protein
MMIYTFGKKENPAVMLLPGIAVYETLKTVMTPEEAFRTVHGYVEAYALSARKMLVGLLRLPELYRLIPGISVRMMHKIFNGRRGLPPKNNGLRAASCGSIW